MLKNIKKTVAFGVLVALTGAQCWGIIQENLKQAITTGNKNEVERLLDAGANANAIDADGSSPLMLAAKTNKADIAQLLLDKGAKVDTINENNGDTAIMYAVKARNIEGIKILMKRGANGHQKNYAQISPYKMAQGMGSNEMMDAMQSKVAAAPVAAPINWTKKLQEAVASNDLNMVKIVIRSRGGTVDVNATGTILNGQGKNPITNATIAVINRTPLIYAAQKGYVDILEILLKEGKANKNLQDSSKRTALDYAKAYTEGFIADKLPGSTRNKMIKLLTQ